MEAMEAMEDNNGDAFVMLYNSVQLDKIEKELDSYRLFSLVDFIIVLFTETVVTRGQP